MRKIFILLNTLVSLIFTSCTPNITNIENNETENEHLQVNKIVESSIVVDNSNPYFFNDKDIKQFSEANFKYKFSTNAYLLDDINNAYEAEIYLSVKHLKELDNGNIYELKFKKPIEFDSEGYLEDYRFNIGILYINKTKIYRLTDISYEKIENLTCEHEILGSESSFVIVCQEEEIEDDSSLIGLHNFLDSDGNIRIFRSYNNLVETGYHERLIWAKDLGLVGFLSGFGAESKSINITLDDIYKKYTSSPITW